MMRDVFWRPSPHFSVIKDRVVKAVVVHSAECPEIARADENVATWFANPKSKVSAHYIVDADTVTQCVYVEHVAWHAGPVNDWTVGIELAGYARQTRTEWLDPYSRGMLDNAAAIVATLCERFSIPVRRTPLELIPKQGMGIYGHADVTEAYGSKGGHWDPGPGFVWPEFLELVNEKLKIAVTL